MKAARHITNLPNQSVNATPPGTLLSSLRKISAALALAATVGATGLAITQLVNPPAAVAYTSRLNLFLTRESDESFEVFVQRAEIVARAAVQRSFDTDVLMTDVIVTVVGDTQGIAVPILTIDVSRSDWRLRPDVAYWGTYYEAAEGLMSRGRVAPMSQ